MARLTKKDRENIEALQRTIDNPRTSKVDKLWAESKIANIKGAKGKRSGSLKDAIPSESKPQARIPVMIDGQDYSGPGYIDPKTGKAVPLGINTNVLGKPGFQQTPAPSGFRIPADAPAQSTGSATAKGASGHES